TPTDTLRAYAQATLAADAAAIGRLTSDGFTYVHSNALYETKADLLAAFEGGRRYRGWDLGATEEHEHAGCTTVTGTASITPAREGAAVLNVRFTATAVRTSDGWQLAAFQSTRLPE